MQTITVTWSGSGQKAAVGAAVSFANVDQAAALGPAAVASGISNNPLAKVFGTLNSGRLLSVLSVNEDSGSVTVDPVSPQTELWDLTANGAILTFVHGAGSTLGGSTDDINDIDMKWTLSASRPWGLIACEAKPLGVRLAIDYEGSVFTATPFGVNALDFQSLQEAVDVGGFVYLPPGGYYEFSKPRFVPPLILPSNKAIHLYGNGWAGTVLSTATGAEEMILITADNQLVEGIRLLGLAPPPGLRGIELARPGGGAALFRVGVKDCAFSGIPSHSIYIADGPGQFSVLGVFEDLNIENLSGGIYIGGNGTTTQFFYRCRVTGHSGKAVTTGAPASALSFIDCIFETQVPETVPYIELVGTEQALFQHCYFEGGQSQTEFILASGEIRGLTIDSCRFRRAGGSYLTALNVTGHAVGVAILNPVMSGVPTPLAPHFIVSSASEQVVLVGGATAEVAGLPVLVSDSVKKLGRTGKAVDLLDQVGGTSGTVATAPGAAMYRVAVYVKTVTAGGSNAKLNVTITWDDGTPNQSDPVISNHDLGTLNAQSNGEVELYLAAGKNITYATTVTGSGTPHYLLRIRAEAL